MDTIRARRAFLASRIESARAEGKTLTYDAEELRALTWALERLEPFTTHDAATPPPIGEPVTVTCDAGTLTAIYTGREYLCACGNPDPLTGVREWSRSLRLA